MFLDVNVILDENIKKYKYARGNVPISFRVKYFQPKNQWTLSMYFLEL